MLGLRTLNEFIAECEKHLKQNPQDQLAREYLYSAYQQKADLLAAMMDSGRSDH
jgi:ribosomal protein S15P/S13E